MQGSQCASLILYTNFVQQSEAFMDKWKEREKTFVTYYRTKWLRKVCRWAINFRNFKHANQNMNGALERYHGIFKQEMKRDKVNIHRRSITWLLGSSLRLENNYWCTSNTKFQGRIRNHAIETLVWNSIHKARAIPNENVILMEHEGQKIVRVKSVSVEGKEHLVVNYNKDMCYCTCSFSAQGNSCKHQVKICLFS